MFPNRNDGNESVGYNLCAQGEAYDFVPGRGTKPLRPVMTSLIFQAKDLTTRLLWTQQTKILLKQGRGLFGVEMKIVDANGKDLPWYEGSSFYIP